MSTPTALTYDRVTYAHPGTGRGVHDVTVSIAAGERVALLGANGAGKSTLLLLATGLLVPRSGTVTVSGLVVQPSSHRAIRRLLAFVFADPDDQLFCPTALDEAAFAMRTARRPEAECLARARAALATMDLADRADRVPSSLSLGEKKRLAIASALASDASLWLLDEPTAGLDPRGRRQLVSHLATLPGTVVLATHDLDAVRTLGARVLLVHEGRVVADDTADRILDDRALLDAHGM